MITILVNIYIDSSEKLFNFKLTLDSLLKLSDNWLVNIRGKMSKEAIKYSKKKLKSKGIHYQLIDQNGWIVNSLVMLKNSKYPYILFFNEDHLSLTKIDYLKKIIKEMEIEKSDYLMYSWWHNGRYVRGIKKVKMKKGRYIDSLFLTKKNWKKICKSGHSYYLISTVGIFKKELLVKMMKRDRKKLHIKLSRKIFSFAHKLNSIGLKINEQSLFKFINKILSYKLKRYQNNTPFEIEKDPSRTDILPIKISIPKKEIFACIDDDHGVKGYSLNNRGYFKKINNRQFAFR